MRTVQLIFIYILSFAIISVGSAAVAMSVHNTCTIMQEQAIDADMVMTSSSLGRQQNMPQMDCMKVKKSYSTCVKNCDSDQHCVMYHVPLAHSASNIFVLHSKPQYRDTQFHTTYSSEFIPTPDLLGLWRPPRTL